jgi:ABC-type uncharacterized transport system substrate-binding protein
VLVNPNNPNAEATLREVTAAGSAIGMEIAAFNASTSREIDAAFASFVRERPDALFVDTGPFFTARRVQLVQLAARHAVPATYAGRQFVDRGGLMRRREPGGCLPPDRRLHRSHSQGHQALRPADSPVKQVRIGH